MPKLTKEEKNAKRVEKDNLVFSMQLELNSLKEKNAIVFRKFYDWKDMSEEVYTDIMTIVKVLGGNLDEDFRNININNYYNKIISKYKTVGKIEDVMMFKTIINKLLMGKFSTYNLFTETMLNTSVPNRLQERISNLLRHLIDLERKGEVIDSNVLELTVQAINSYDDEIKRSYSNLKEQLRSMERLRFKLKDNINHDKEEKERDFKILDLIDEISNEINTYFNNLDCECLEDLEIFIEELNTVRNSLRSKSYNIIIIADFMRSMSPENWSSGNNFNRFIENDHLHDKVLLGLESYLIYIKRRNKIRK